MRAAPALRGGLVVRLAWLVVGLFLFSCGIVFFLASRLGLPPWDVLHQGLAKHTPLSFGAANEVVGVLVLALAWWLGAKVGIGTVANAVLIGFFVVLLQPLVSTDAVEDVGLPGRIALLAAGLVLFGGGSALYIGAPLRAGPRDSLMLVGAERSGLRIGWVRALIESTVLLIGFALGGHVGAGTVFFAAL